MSQFAKVKRSKDIVFVLMVFSSLVLCSILYPALRYEKTSMGSTEIAYDKLTGVISLKDSLNPKSEWIPTVHKDIMETKYYLAAKELDQAFNEVRKETHEKPRKRVGLKEIRVIPAPPFD